VHVEDRQYDNDTPRIDLRTADLPRPQAGCLPSRRRASVCRAFTG